jgi:hypothetical protein
MRFLKLGLWRSADCLRRSGRDPVPEAQEGFVDAAVPLSLIHQVKHLDPNLFLLNCRALRPRPNRLLDMKTDAAAC